MIVLPVKGKEEKPEGCERKESFEDFNRGTTSKNGLLISYLDVWI